MQDTSGAAQIELDNSTRSTPALRPRADLLRNCAMVALGTLLTLSVYGYRFGEGNHTIYLLDPLRRTHPELLGNDWFTTQTLQYHAVFGWITHKLMQWNIVEPAFLAGYVLLVVMFHVAWLGIARQFSASMSAYVLALVLLYASAAGAGLGFYQFFQDSSLLASNVANVALLWGFYLWIAGKFTLSGLCFGLAGLFHLNHALVGAGMWVVLCILGMCASSERDRAAKTRSAILVGSLLALIPSIANILLAANAKLARSGSMPLGEFIDLYVRFRHPHHYDPSTWPVWLWVSFLWPIPMALVWMWRRRDAATVRLKRIFLILLGLQVIALLGAGLWYVSETLVQMSLWRFSIFAQLLACTAVAVWIVEGVRGRARGRATVALIASAACAAMLAACAIRGPFFGAFVMHEDDSEYRALCEWARRNTPVDAIFLVPPGESGFRLHARRAIVVNFKAVPQLSGELREWRHRLRNVLHMDDLGALPRGYDVVQRALDERYASLSADQLLLTARNYRARFIVTNRAHQETPALRELFSTPSGRSFLYDAGDAEGDSVERR